MSLRYLDFDHSEDGEGTGTWDALASVTPAHWEALRTESGNWTRGFQSEGYRRCCTSIEWPAEALAARGQGGERGAAAEQGPGFFEGRGGDQQGIDPEDGEAEGRHELIR